MIQPENWFCKEVGFSKDSSKLVGQMTVSARRKIGLKSIETLPENWFWKEVGCRRNFSTAGDPRGFQKVRAKSENLKKRSENGKEVLSRIHSVTANGTGIFSV